MYRATAALAAILLALPAAHGADDWRFGLTADVMRDDNATRGIYDGKKADTVAVAEGSASRSWMLSPQSGLLVRGAARYSRYADIKDISNLALIGRAAWRFQRERAFGAPWFELAGQAQALRHADSELRDGSILTVEGSVGSHVTDRLRLSGGLGADRRSGGGDVGLYDLTTTRIFGTADVRIGVRNTLYARAAYHMGDHVFSSGSTKGLSGVWADDPALRAPLGLAEANVYRVDATTTLLEVGFNFPLAPARALDFSATRVDSKIDEGAYQGNKYGATIVRASYVHRFQ